MKTKRYFGLRIKSWAWIIIIILLSLNSFYITSVVQASTPPDVEYYPATLQSPQSEHQQIVEYITQVFGKDAPKAFRLLECENRSLNPLAVHDNEKWGQGIGQDIGVFQINNYWQGVQNKFLKNWKVNIEIAHQLFVENDNSFKLWTCGRKLGI